MGLYTTSSLAIIHICEFFHSSHYKITWNHVKVIFLSMSARGFTYMLHACKHRSLPVHPKIIQLTRIHSSVVCLRLQVDKHPYIIWFSSFKYYHAVCYLFKAHRDCFASSDRDLHTRSIIYTHTKPTDSMHTNKYRCRSSGMIIQG